MLMLAQDQLRKLGQVMWYWLRWDWYYKAPSNALFSWKLPGGLALLLISVSVNAATVIHIYDLNGRVEDALGGPDMVLRNLTGLGPTGYTFNAGEGPRLRNAINPNTYSIEMRFRIDDTTGRKKLIDFKNRSSDRGLYNRDSRLRFFSPWWMDPAAP